MAITKVPKPASTATALLALDESQIAQYLTRNDDIEGGFVLSALDGIEDLSGSQQDELERKLRAAADCLTASKPLQINELLTRLTAVTREQDDDDDSPIRRLSPSPAGPFESTEATPPPISALEAEACSYRELVRAGGRPACSVEELSNLVANPAGGYGTLSPWLSDHPGYKNEEGDVKTVFTRQLARWWDFKRSQWDNRGVSDGDAGFSAFFESCRRKHDQMGAVTSGSSFEMTIRRQWQQKRASREFRVPDRQVFPLYRDAVRRRLTRYGFARNLQLKKDPRQQNRRTNWLEYVGYEQLCLDRQRAVVDSLERQSHQAWKKLLLARRTPLLQERNSSHEINAPVGSARSRHDQQYRRVGKAMNLSKELEAARAELDATGKVIDDFIREMARYRHASTAVYYQRLRVEWAVKEARLIETETCQQREAARSCTTIDREDERKRRHDDDDDDDGEEEEDNVPELRLKRSKHGDDMKGAISDASQGHVRRSKRLVERKNKV